MSILIGLLTALLVLDCIVLVFLILLQLPKKEAGAGVAFGGAATDALFGAGSGNVLTKVTTYAATAFFGIVLILAIAGRANKPTGGTLEEELTRQSAPPASAPAAPASGKLLPTTPNTSGAPSSPAAPAAPAPKK